MQMHKNDSIAFTSEDWNLGAVPADAGIAADQMFHGETTGYDDTIRWPLWKTIVFVVGLCGSFWIAAAALLIRFLG